MLVVARFGVRHRLVESLVFFQIVKKFHDVGADTKLALFTKKAVITVHVSVFVVVQKNRSLRFEMKSRLYVKQAAFRVSG